MGAPWAFLGCWCLRRRSREELLLGVHGSWSFPISTETSEFYGLTWAWVALLLPVLNGVDGHQSALLHTFISTSGDIQGSFCHASPSQCSQQIATYFLSLLLIECIWPVKLDIYGTFIGTSVLQAKRTSCRHFFLI